MLSDWGSSVGRMNHRLEKVPFPWLSLHSLGFSLATKPSSQASGGPVRLLPLETEGSQLEGVRLFPS